MHKHVLTIALLLAIGLVIIVLLHRSAVTPVSSTVDTATLPEIDQLSKTEKDTSSGEAETYMSGEARAKVEGIAASAPFPTVDLADFEHLDQLSSTELDTLLTRLRDNGTDIPA